MGVEASEFEVVAVGIAEGVSIKEGIPVVVVPLAGLQLRVAQERIAAVPQRPPGTALVAASQRS